MNRKMNKPHDTRQTELFKNKEAFISLLKDCVKAEWLNDLDTDSLTRSNNSFILQDFRKKEADIVYEGTINNGKQKVIFYVLLELQSKVDYRMPYRLLLYMTEILRHHYNNSDPKARKRKGFMFPAVIPVVYFSGTRKWTVPTCLREMFDGHERFGDSLLNFSYSLVDVKGYDDDSVQGFHSRLLKVMMMFERAENLAELTEMIKKYEDDISLFDDEELRIITAAVDILSNQYSDSKTETTGNAQIKATAERMSGMFENLIANEKKRERQLINQGREQGREEGREQGREEGREQERKLREEERNEMARTLLEMGISIENVALATKLSIENIIELQAASPTNPVE